MKPSMPVRKRFQRVYNASKSELLDSSSSKELTHVHLGRFPLRRELRNAEETLAEFDEAIGSVHGVDPKSSQTRLHLAIESPPSEPVWSHSIPSTPIW